MHYKNKQKPFYFNKYLQILFKYFYYYQKPNYCLTAEKM